MEKKLAKAIRLVNGYNDDLRVNLCDNVHMYIIQSFLESHAMELFCINLDVMNDEQRERFIHQMAWNICAGNSSN